MISFSIQIGASVLDAPTGLSPGAVGLELLKDSLRHYAAYHPPKSKSRYQIQHSLELYDLWLGRPAAVGDLRADRVNEWLCSLEKRYSQRTVSGHRANLLTVWRDCADRGIADVPRRIRKVSKPEPKPEAWLVDEVERLLESAKNLPGHLPNGVSRARYFEIFLRCGWETGLRRSDLWAIKRGDIRSGCIYIRQQKTGTVETWELSSDLAVLVSVMPGEKPLCWPQSEWMFDYWFRVIKAAAGISNGKHAHGLRCSAATDLKKNGASAEQIQKFLGHKNLESQRNYVDRSVAKVNKPKPSQLNLPFTQDLDWPIEL